MLSSEFDACDVGRCPAQRLPVVKWRVALGKVTYQRMSQRPLCLLPLHFRVAPKERWL